MFQLQPKTPASFVQLTGKSQRDASLKRSQPKCDSNCSSLALCRYVVHRHCETYAWGVSYPGDDMELMAQYAESPGYFRKHPRRTLPAATGKATRDQIEVPRASWGFGISTGYIGDTLYTLLTGKVVSRFKEGGEDIDVRLQLDEEQRRSLSDLSRVYLPTPNGNIALSQVTEQVFSTAPRSINRFDRSREIALAGNLQGISMGDFNKAFAQA